MTAVRALPRRTASPYARKLARERGIDLTALRGSGPGGRVVAIDVPFPPQRAAEADAPPPPLAMTVLAASARIDTANGLVRELAAAGHDFALDDFVLKAGAAALRAAMGDGCAIAFHRRDAPAVLVTDADRMSLTALRAQLLSGPRDGTAVLRLRISASARVRVLVAPPPPGHAASLVATIGPDTAELVLTFDAGRLGEDRAEALLEHLSAALETPLRLLA